MATIMILLGLRSADPLVPCQCRLGTPGWRVFRHFGGRNGYAALMARKAR